MGNEWFRGLLTETEREILTGERDDISDSYRTKAISRIRKKITELETDARLIESHHNELAGELHSAVCESSWEPPEEN